MSIENQFSLDGHRIVGKYEISNMCNKTYPCKHHIKNMETGEVQTYVLGDKIYEMLKADGISDPHFNEYKEFIRKRDNPTQEEIQEKIEKERRIKESMDKWKREREELAKITNTYKASSRLEKLKNKNNIAGNVFS